uniref:Phosphatidylglycerophosphatase and protein-tyrosine phosphatase 1 n=1 Tax=Oncorhynchus tshawytscha TaxID=74940 RepID=A0AAZ3SFW4_ONCTS
MSGALARVLFYPTLAYNVVMEKVSSRRWFNRVDQTVILGALPFKSMTKELVQTENVRGVITMNEEYETKYFCNSAEEWKAEGVEQLRLSTVDLTGVPSLENLHRGVEFALSHREKGSSVYVHCKAGRCRSATLAAAYIIRFVGLFTDTLLESRGSVSDVGLCPTTCNNSFITAGDASAVPSASLWRRFHLRVRLPAYLLHLYRNCKFSVVKMNNMLLEGIFDLELILLHSFVTQLDQVYIV